MLANSGAGPWETEILAPHYCHLTFFKLQLKYKLSTRWRGEHWNYPVVFGPNAVMDFLKFICKFKMLANDKNIQGAREKRIYFNPTSPKSSPTESELRDTECGFMQPLDEQSHFRTMIAIFAIAGRRCRRNITLLPPAYPSTHCYMPELVVVVTSSTCRYVYFRKRIISTIGQKTTE